MHILSKSLFEKVVQTANPKMNKFSEVRKEGEIKTSLSYHLWLQQTSTLKRKRTMSFQFEYSVVSTQKVGNKYFID